MGSRRVTHTLARVLPAPVFGVPVWLCTCGERCRSTDEWDRHIGDVSAQVSVETGSTGPGYDGRRKCPRAALTAGGVTSTYVTGADMSDITHPEPFDGHAAVEVAVLGAAHWLARAVIDEITESEDPTQAFDYYAGLLIEQFRAHVVNNGAELVTSYSRVVDDMYLAQRDNRVWAKAVERGKEIARKELRDGPPLRKPIPGKTRLAVFERDAYRCVICQSWQDLTIDHIHPVAHGGNNHIDNLQTMCRRCNSAKGARV